MQLIRSSSSNSNQSFQFSKNKTANFGRQKTFFYVNSIVVPYAKSVAVQGHIFSQQYIVGSPDFGTV